MTGKPRPLPPQSKPAQQPVSQLPAREVTRDMSNDPVFLELYYRAIQGLVQRSDLEWHREHLSRRALEYAHAAYKELKGL